MDEKPKKLESKQRWFRFRLSTVLILTAILAGAMACLPWYGEWVYQQGKWVEWDSIVEIRRDEPFIYTLINPRLKWFAVAMVAFLLWKAAWAVFELRRRRTAASE